MSAPTPPRETERLAALRRYAVLDTPPERAFDRITALAARLFDVPIALVSLVDADRQWFKSCLGLDVRETSRDLAFCAHAILAEEPLVVPDATQDERFVNNALVAGPPRFRFYAGAPLRTPDGFLVGTLCVLDRRPRTLSAKELTVLVDLAAMVVDELELRLAVRMRAMFERLAQMSPDLIYIFDLAAGRNLYDNRAPTSVLGYDVAEVGSEIPPWMFHPDDLRKVQAHFADREYASGADKMQLTCRVKGASGAYRWFHAREAVFERDERGKATHRLGIASEITALKEAEAKLEALAMTDEMTGLPNFRRFRQRMLEFIAEGARGRSFALAIIDVDHFKKVNDVHGHPVGDTVLISVAGTLRQQLRRVDFLARYGGEEFCALFADTDNVTAVDLAERLRHAVAASKAPVSVTVSIGVCVYSQKFADDAKGLSDAADKALYTAKAAGRNRVVRFE
ncbi:MAG TPA: diguanylate cyclase [Polyangiaceae bacterium]|nr:diguanylate cyclase [Polyangiaceae bacterium]